MTTLLLITIIILQLMQIACWIAINILVQQLRRNIMAQQQLLEEFRRAIEK